MGNKIYTGCGDDGYSDIINERLEKDDDIFELLGSIDEATSQLGFAKALIEDKEIKKDIEEIQKKLIFLMGEVAGAENKVKTEDISCCEALCDKYTATGFDGFVLTGENLVSASLDIARTVVRRAERVAVRLYKNERINKNIIVYLNRLSDLIYLMARYFENKEF